MNDLDRELLKRVVLVLGDVAKCLELVVKCVASGGQDPADTKEVDDRLDQIGDRLKGIAKEPE